MAGVWAGQVPGSRTTGFLDGSLSPGKQSLDFPTLRAQGLGQYPAGSPCPGPESWGQVGWVGQGPGFTRVSLLWAADCEQRPPKDRPNGTAILPTINLPAHRSLAASILGCARHSGKPSPPPAENRGFGA